MSRKGIPYSRFSGKRQEAGDSQRRQDELAEQAARDEGVELDRTLSLSDKGISAFRGKNWKRGDLGKFLDLVDAGVIARGTVLIVEQVNRLSRMPWMQQVELWKEILSRDIVIRTCVPPARYTKDNINDLAMGCPVVIFMMLAHLDSQQKSEWIKRAWGEKKRKAAQDGCPHGRGCPEWLNAVHEPHPRDPSRTLTTCYELIAERAAHLVQIFRWALGGWGAMRITQALNKSGEPAWNRAAVAHAANTGGVPRWRIGWVKYILQCSQVTGEYQPEKMTEQGMVPDGPAVPGYYPAAVEPGLFRSVQALRRQRSKAAGKGGGRRGKDGVDTNLFTGLVNEALTRRSFYINTASYKGETYRYLATDPASSNIPYEDFEAAALDALSHLKVNDVDGRSQADELGSLVERLQQERTALGLELEALDVQLRELPPARWPNRVVARVADLEEQVAAKDEELRLAKEAASTSGRSEALAEVQTCVRLLVEEVRGTDREAGVRERIKTRLPMLVDSFWVAVQRVNMHCRLVHVRMYLHGGESRYFRIRSGKSRSCQIVPWPVDDADFRAGDVAGCRDDALVSPDVIADPPAGEPGVSQGEGE
jgi:DNA invertase Pin-like site-specific DNA recombinase